MHPSERAAAYRPLAVTSRSGADESLHWGAVVGLGPDGTIEMSIGDPQVTIYPRSSNKPMQAVAMVRAGLDLAPDLLALVCASHDGTPAHLAAARRILATVGLDESALANTADLPLDPAAAEAVLRAGGARTALQMNCSGKHSGMVATCVHNGWAHEAGGYLDIAHPLQQAITTTLADLAAERIGHIGVDGCGAPAHMVSLVGLARAFRAIAVSTPGSAEHAVYSAMTAHPEMVGGARRDVTTFMRHVPGLMTKDGAEGVMAAALPDGRAIALKIADGASRARPAVLVAALEQLGVPFDGELAELVTEPIRGHGHPVGSVRAVFQ